MQLHILISSTVEIFHNWTIDLRLPRDLESAISVVIRTLVIQAADYQAEDHQSEIEKKTLPTSIQSKIHYVVAHSTETV